MTNAGTCAAISSPLGTGAIALIRVSGSDALQISDKIFISRSGKSLNSISSHTVIFGDIVNAAGEKLDEVLVTVFLSPHSFTGEDTVEISCHGGLTVTRMIQDELLKNGARLAEPGEFSKRAFLNGKIDLSKAEAIIDLINSKTDLAVLSNTGQMTGRLSDKINIIRNKALLITARILAKVDFPEDEIDEVFELEAQLECQNIIDDINKLLATFEMGRILNQGLNVVIAGKPNVGKSSLLNALLSEDRAIVTNMPGTTRDIIDASLNICGIPIVVSDTAGIRKAQSEIENIGVKRAFDKINDADLIILMLDASMPINNEDKEIIEFVKGKKLIALVNKIDLDNKIDMEYIKESLPKVYTVRASMLTGEGIDYTRELIKKMFLNEDIKIGQDAIIANTRQKDSLMKALHSFEQACGALLDGYPADVVTIDINTGISALGEITGLKAQDEVIEKIFSQFCLGK